MIRVQPLKCIIFQEVKNNNYSQSVMYNIALDTKCETLKDIIYVYML